MKEKSEEIQNKNDTIAYIKFCNEIKKIKMVDNFTEMKKKICKILQLNEESFKKLTLSYKDDDDDLIQVVTEEDYSILLDQMKTKQVDILNIEMIENSEVDINECLSSIVKFKEDFDDDENRKNVNNNINIVSNQCFEINKQEKPESNFKIIEKEDDENNINNENNINTEKKINNENNISNENNINNEKNANKENKFFMQGSASPFIPNNNNINNSAYNIPMTMVFPYNCNLCNKYPIVNVLYHCPKCSIFLCQDCEEKLGINHRHSILKAQTKQQFDDLNIKINYNINGDYSNNDNNNSNESQIDKYAHLVKDKISDTLGGVINIFHTLNNNGNQNNQSNNQNANVNNVNNINNNQHTEPQQMSLIQLARTQYNLEGVTNDQLEDALKKANGNIDEAVFSLFQ